MKRWLLLTLVACGKPPVVAPPADPPHPVEAEAPEPARLPGRGEVRVDGLAQGPVFRVEVARTDAERQQGLMFRRHLADADGMLFFMPSDDDHAFWMRNTYLRLDMVFIDRDWQVVGVLEDVPPLNDDHRMCGTPSRYVLELGAHVARHHGITVGTRVNFRDVTGARP